MTDEPYSCRWGSETVPDGSYSFRAVATDLAGNPMQTNNPAETLTTFTIVLQEEDVKYTLVLTDFRGREFPAPQLLGTPPLAPFPGFPRNGDQPLTNFLKLQQKRTAAGLPETDISLHMVFTGNPGTGNSSTDSPANGGSGNAGNPGNSSGSGNPGTGNPENTDNPSGSSGGSGNAGNTNTGGSGTSAPENPASPGNSGDSGSGSNSGGTGSTDNAGNNGNAGSAGGAGDSSGSGSGNSANPGNGGGPGNTGRDDATALGDNWKPWLDEIQAETEKPGKGGSKKSSTGSDRAAASQRQVDHHRAATRLRLCLGA